MTGRSSATSVCAMLERREAALARSAAAAATRCRSAMVFEDDRSLIARSTLTGAGRWSAACCGFVYFRTERCAAVKRRLAIDANRARAEASEHETRRRYWATLVRGLERRDAHRKSIGVPCLD